MSDLKLIMTVDGSRLQFAGGQPLLDDGLENLALISLFTQPGWCGNVLLPEAIGSDFEVVCNQPITRSSLNQIRNAAERALDNPLFGKVQVAVSNPRSHNLQISILIEPPGQSAYTLSLFRSGGVWYSQAADPAYLKVDNSVTYELYSLDDDFILDKSTLF